MTDAVYSLGFHRGWVQQLDAADNYQPHFDSSSTTFGNEQNHINS